MKKKVILLLCILLALSILTAWIIWDNNRILVTEYTVSNPSIPEEFSGFRILQISDLHNRDFGNGNKKLLQRITALQPDIILITGDLIDSYHTNVDISLSFIQEAVKLVPTYYVFGNHEVRIPKDYLRLKEGLLESGVTVLDDTAITLEKGNDNISLLGIHDPSAFQINPELYGQTVDDMIEQKDAFPELYTVALCHRPEVFDVFVDNEIDLLFSGHTHGGQLRLPLIGAIFCPDQGFFPQYDTGIFTEQNTTMIICQGLGNSSFPFRVNCPPEIVVATLINEKG